MANTDNLQTVLVQEFNLSCDMIKLAIDNMDENIWSEVSNNWSYVRTLYQILEAIEFYSFDEPKDLSKEGFGICEPNLPEDVIKKIIDSKPKAFFLEYLENVRKLVSEKISNLTFEELLAKDKFTEWGFTSRYHKFSYTLRHSMLHTGELNKNLRDLEKKRINWL